MKYCELEMDESANKAYYYELFEYNQAPQPRTGPSSRPQRMNREVNYHLNTSTSSN